MARSHNSYDGELQGWNDYPPQYEQFGNGTWSVCNIEYNIITNVGQVMADVGGIFVDGCNWNFSTSTGTLRPIQLDRRRRNDRVKKR